MDRANPVAVISIRGVRRVPQFQVMSVLVFCLLLIRNLTISSITPIVLASKRKISGAETKEKSNPAFISSKEDTETKERIP